MIQDDNRLIMSDSLRGRIQDLDQEATEKPSDSSFVVALEFEFDLILGNLSGISIENNCQCLKVDIYTSLNEAYQVIKEVSNSKLSCRVFYLRLGSDELCIEGPFEVSSAKMLEIDRQNKLCVLGVDLIKS